MLRPAPPTCVRPSPTARSSSCAAAWSSPRTCWLRRPDCGRGPRRLRPRQHRPRLRPRTGDPGGPGRRHVGPPVAEFTFALLLSLARKVTLADRLLREGDWPKPRLGGPLLHGKTLGIVGAGNIGGLVGQMGHAWGMRVLGCVAHPSNDTVAEQLARGA